MLICFPCAGGTKGFFDEIEKDLQGIDVIKLEYAGHGERHKEPFCKNFGELGDDLFRNLKEYLVDSNFALFGYSMGSISLVEVLKRIIANGFPKPKQLFLAAHEPQTKSELLGFGDDEQSEWIKQRTIKFGAVPERLLNNEVFWRTYLPIFRADYAIIGKYAFEDLALNDEIPATVFYSETDTPLKNMKQWEKFFPCDYYHFHGSHFFIRERHKEMADIIMRKINYDLR